MFISPNPFIYIAALHDARGGRGGGVPEEAPRLSRRRDVAGRRQRARPRIRRRQARPEVGRRHRLLVDGGGRASPKVLDLFSRKVVGWCLSDAPDTRLVLAAPGQAATLRRITPDSGLLFHSDQGCQYTSHASQDRLAALGIRASMSCWDNAVTGASSEA